MRRLVGVGVGPGDPEMLTVGALRRIREADHVLAPTIAMDRAGRAEEVVRAAVGEIVVDRIVFDMEAGSAGQALRNIAAEHAAQSVAGKLAEGGTSVFITLGDVSLYSTFYPLQKAVRAILPDIVVEMVPGITAFSYLAAQTTTDLLDNSERLYVVAVLNQDDLTHLRLLLSDAQASLVLYKCGRRFGAVREALAEAGRLDSALVGEQMGTMAERIAPAKEFNSAGLSYFATVILPALRS